MPAQLGGWPTLCTLHLPIYSLWQSQCLPPARHRDVEAIREVDGPGGDVAPLRRHDGTGAVSAEGVVAQLPLPLVSLAPFPSKAPNPPLPQRSNVVSADSAQKVKAGQPGPHGRALGRRVSAGWQGGSGLSGKADGPDTFNI